ncbi:hypothetical protein MBLNU230_g7811t1 [Neophaeotheca triangularis]
MASSHNYNTWTHGDLINRVTTLETQLRARNAELAQLSSPTPPKKQPKKAPKPFDPSRYHNRHIALKFAYLGGRYNGFEHHTGNTTPLPTIEEELWKALKKTRLILTQADEVNWEACEYSKCGRTDRGVSAFGQVIGIRVRSARPVQRERAEQAVVEGEGGAVSEEQNGVAQEDVEETLEEPRWDPVNDELPYIQLLNRVLPQDIRVLAWCPDPPQDFSARFNCRERRYRYFFTNPAYPPVPVSQPPGVNGEGWLDIPAMQEAAAKYEGLHDFRNFCKIDASKQITNYDRRIFSARVLPVSADGAPETTEEGQSRAAYNLTAHPSLYYFEVRGSAFLWHQVRHLIAVLFLVGQGYEKPSIVDELLDPSKVSSKPNYEMASDVPLVLWDCVFPDLDKLSEDDHVYGEKAGSTSYEDGMNWIYVGEEAGGRERAKRSTPGIEDGKYGRNGLLEDLWALWRTRKMDEILAGSLMEVIARQGYVPKASDAASLSSVQHSERVFDGSEMPRTVGTYVPLLRRSRTEPFAVLNARYAARKGLKPKDPMDVDGK